MFTLAFWVIFGVGYPCQSEAVETGDMQVVRPAWSFINTRPERVCEASKNVEALMITLDINPFEAVEHEAAPLGLDID